MAAGGCRCSRCPIAHVVAAGIAASWRDRSRSVSSTVARYHQNAQPRCRQGPPNRSPATGSTARRPFRPGSSPVGPSTPRPSAPGAAPTGPGRQQKGWPPLPGKNRWGEDERGDQTTTSATNEPNHGMTSTPIGCTRPGSTPQAGADEPADLEVCEGPEYDRSPPARPIHGSPTNSNRATDDPSSPPTVGCPAVCSSCSSPSSPLQARSSGPTTSPSRRPLSFFRSSEGPIFWLLSRWLGAR